MEPLSLFDIQPTVMSHSFNKSRQSFMLDEDTCPEWVILAAEEGEFEFEVCGSKGTATFGDLVICPPGTLLRRKVLKTLSYHFFMLSWKHNNDEKLSSQDPNIPTGIITIKDTGRLSSNFSYIKKTTDPNDFWGLKRKSHLLYDTLCLYRAEQNHSTMSPFQKNEEDSDIQKAALFMQEQPFQDISMKSLADSLDMSPVQFIRRFNKIIGTTPGKYLSAIRIQQAQSLLSETTMTLDQIGVKCGFESGFYFSRVFKKKFGISPSHYRQVTRV